MGKDACTGSTTLLFPILLMATVVAMVVTLGLAARVGLLRERRQALGDRPMGLGIAVYHDGQEERRKTLPRPCQSVLIPDLTPKRRRNPPHMVFLENVSVLYDNSPHCPLTGVCKG